METGKEATFLHFRRTCIFLALCDVGTLPRNGKLLHATRHDFSFVTACSKLSYRPDAIPVTG